MNPASPKKKGNKAEKEKRFRTMAYIFRKNVKIVIAKLKKSKLTVKDIFQQKLFSEEPYQFGKAIFEAVKAGEETKVWRYFIENKFVFYSVDSTGKTPLIWACIRGHTSITAMLLERGCLVNKRDFLGHNAVYYALHYGHEECLKLLLLHLATLQAEDVEKAQGNKRLKNIVQLCLSIMSIIQRMPYEKRKVLFEVRLNHLS